MSCGITGPSAPTRPASVHLAEFPEPDPRWDDDQRDARWDETAQTPRADLDRARRPEKDQDDRQRPGGEGADRHQAARSLVAPSGSCWRRFATSRRSKSSPTPRPPSRSSRPSAPRIRQVRAMLELSAHRRPERPASHTLRAVRAGARGNRELPLDWLSEASSPGRRSGLSGHRVAAESAVRSHRKFG